MYTQLIHAAVQQKVTQPCKAINFQLKIKSKFKREKPGLSLRRAVRIDPHQASVGSGAAFILNVDVLLIMEFFFPLNCLK